MSTNKPYRWELTIRGRVTGRTLPTVTARVERFCRRMARLVLQGAGPYEPQAHGWSYSVRPETQRETRLWDTQIQRIGEKIFQDGHGKR